MLIALDRSICMMALTRSPVLVDFLRALATTIRVHLQRIPICLNEAHLIKGIFSHKCVNFYFRYHVFYSVDV